MKRIYAHEDGQRTAEPQGFKPSRHLVTPATREHERRASAPYWTGRNLSYPGQAGKWIGNAWYPAKPRQFAREAMGHILRETLYTLRPDGEPDIAPHWAIY